MIEEAILKKGFSSIYKTEQKVEESKAKIVKIMKDDQRVKS